MIKKIPKWENKTVSPRISYTMSRNRGKNTSIERVAFSYLKSLKLDFKRHAKDLPGKPDIIFLKAKIAIFINGDFWHGWQFPRWQNKFSNSYWRAKISYNRKRHKNNLSKLKRIGWKAFTIWEHQIKEDKERAFLNAISFLGKH
jgi:DNA mismatch endonuclease, patch repair protein